MSQYPHAMTPPVLDDELNENIRQILWEFREGNSSYGIMRHQREVLIARPTHLEIQRKAEETYIKTLYLALQPNPTPETIKGRLSLPAIRHELADIYAQNALIAMELRGAEIPDHAYEEKRQQYEGMLKGTLSTTLTNMLKNKGLVPEHARTGGLGL